MDSYNHVVFHPQKISENPSCCNIQCLDLFSCCQQKALTTLSFWVWWHAKQPQHHSASDCFPGLNTVHGISADPITSVFWNPNQAYTSLIYGVLHVFPLICPFIVIFQSDKFSHMYHYVSKVVMSILC